MAEGVMESVVGLRSEGHPRTNCSVHALPPHVKLVVTRILKVHRGPIVDSKVNWEKSGKRTVNVTSLTLQYRQSRLIAPNPLPIHVNGCGG